METVTERENKIKRKIKKKKMEKVSSHTEHEESEQDDQQENKASHESATSAFHEAAPASHKQSGSPRKLSDSLKSFETGEMLKNLEHFDDKLKDMYNRHAKEIKKVNLDDELKKFDKKVSNLESLVQGIK